jgi:hypothetical protein
MSNLLILTTNYYRLYKCITAKLIVLHNLSGFNLRLVKNLIIVQLFSRFPIRISWFSTVFIRVHHWNLFWARWIQFKLSHTIYIKSSSISSSLLLDPPKCLLPSRFKLNFFRLIQFSSSSQQLHLPTLMMFLEEYTSCTSSLCKYCRVFARQYEKKLCGFSDLNEYLLNSHFYTHTYNYSQLITTSDVPSSLLQLFVTLISVKCLPLCSELNRPWSRVGYELTADKVG